MKKKIFAVLVGVFFLMVSSTTISGNPPQCWKCTSTGACESTDGSSGHTGCAHSDPPLSMCVEYAWSCPLW